MKKSQENEEEIRPEYDLTKLLQGGIRGKHAARFREGTNLVLLAPDVAAAFGDEESVNQALRLVMQLARLPMKTEQRTPGG